VTVSAVLFDLNGTLVDDVPRATWATNEVLAAAGLATMDEEAFRSAFRLPLAAFFDELGLNGGAVPAWDTAMASRPAPVMAGAVETLTHLRGRGLRTGVVSAAGCEPVRRDLDQLGLAPLLDEVHCAVADKTAVLRDAVASAGGTVVYVGDTEYDVLAAREAGAWAVAFLGGYRDAEQLQAAQPWSLCRSLTDLPELLAGPGPAPS